MIVQCGQCSRWFDDQFRFTNCPHPTFAANDGVNNFSHHHDAYISDAEPGEQDRRRSFDAGRELHQRMGGNR